MNKSQAKVITTDRQIDAALARARHFASGERRVLRADYETRPDLITLYLDDGIRVSIPRTKLQGLERAETDKVAKIEILGRGTGLHWPLLDVDHYVPGLLNCVFGTARWMADLGRRGGSARTKAKAAAARANGKKGGRPKRRVA
jgi:ABC-type transporter Mla subunit MlaD